MSLIQEKGSHWKLPVEAQILDLLDKDVKSAIMKV